MATLAGIPGSINAEAARIRWYRQPDAVLGGMKVYMADVADGRLVAMVSRDDVQPGQPTWHLSLSHRQADGVTPDRVPNWDELKHAAYRLIPDDVPMVLVFPRRSTPPAMYVNIHETTLHLWESVADPNIDR
jgi:hypothetical protein